MGGTYPYPQHVMYPPGWYPVGLHHLSVMTRGRGLHLPLVTSAIPALGAENRNFTVTFTVGTFHLYCIAKALAKRLDICTEHALDKCPVQNVVSFCHLVQSCSVVFSDVESCSVDFEGSQKCSVDKIKFLLFEENVQSFCHPTEHCPVCASALQMQEREFRHDVEEMESSASICSMSNRERYSGSNEDSSLTRSIAVLMTTSIAENEDTMILMAQAAGLIDLPRFS